MTAGDDGKPPWEYTDEEKEQVLSALDHSPVDEDEADWPADDGPYEDEVSWRDEAERVTPEYYGLCTPDSLDDMALDAENRYPQGYR